MKRASATSCFVMRKCPLPSTRSIFIVSSPVKFGRRRASCLVVVNRLLYLISCPVPALPLHLVSPPPVPLPGLVDTNTSEAQCEAWQLHLWSEVVLPYPFVSFCLNRRRTSSG